MSISVIPIKTIDECRIIEDLQRIIWDSTNLEVAPDHLVWTIAKEGGLVLLARTETGEPVGFGYGFLGRTADQRLKLASHQVGVLPVYQSQGVGYLIKLAQRKYALADGLELITWTFDPLQGRNANLNLRKLGTVCNTYLPNLYGEMRDELNQGLPSDRFRVDWWIASEWVAARIDGKLSVPQAVIDYPILNPASARTGGVLVPPDDFDTPQDPFCLVEFPADINQVKIVSFNLALRWRLQTQEIFQTAFAAGYSVVDLLRQKGRNYYLLQKNWQRK